MRGRSHPWLSETEYVEFNEITYDRIRSCDDIEKLRRLERYMSEEGFPQTADVARQTIIDKGGLDPHQTEPPITDSEVNDLMKNIQLWETSIKGKDEKLKALQMGTATQVNGDSFHGKLLAVRKSRNAQKEEVQNPKKSESKNDVQNDLKNCEKSNEYALQNEEKAAQNQMRTEEGKGNCASELHALKDGNNNNINSQNNIKILNTTSSKTDVEREWLSQREREKGNDLYKAKEYNASADAYTHAIELFPGSAAAYCNRAAAFLKMKRWVEAYEDCCKSLEIDPIYVKALTRRGMASLKMEKPKKALKDLEDALALDPTNYEIMKLKQNAEGALQTCQDDNLKGNMKQKINYKQNEQKSSEIIPAVGSKRLTIEEVDGTGNVKRSQELLTCERILTESGGNRQQEKSLQKQNKQVCIKELNQDGLMDKTSGEKSLEMKNKKVLIQEIYGDGRLEKHDPTKQSEANSVFSNGFLTKEIKKTYEVKKQVVKMHEPNKISVSIIPSEKHNFQQETGTRSNGTGTSPKSVNAEANSSSNPPPQAAATSKVIHDSNQVSIKKYFSESLCFPKASDTSDCKEPSMSSAIHLANEWQLKGYNFLSNGEINEALKCYTQSLSVSPNNVLALSGRALCHLKLKNFEAAVQDSSRSISLNPGFAKAYHCRGLALRALKRLEKAKEDLQKALEAHPGDKSIHEELESIEAEIEDSMYRPMRVGPMVIEELEDDDLNLSQKVDSVASLLPTAYNAQSSSIEVTYPNQVEKVAVQHAEQLRLKGNMQVQKGEYVAAVNSYSRSIELNPLVAATYANRALCYMKLESIREAEQDCTEAIRLDQCYIKAYYRRAIVLQQLGDLRGALRDLKVAMEYLPQDQEIQNRFKEINMLIEQESLKDEPSSLNVCDQSPLVHQSFQTASTMHEEEEQLENFLVRAQVDSHSLGQAENVPRMEKKMIKEKLQKPLKIPGKPKTTLEFERSCLGLQNHPDALRKYMKSIDVKQFPNIFKESLGASTMKVIIESLQKAFLPDDTQGAFNILEGLSKVRRLKLAVMLLSPMQRLELLDIFEWLIKSGQFSQKDVQKLKEKYI